MRILALGGIFPLDGLRAYGHEVMAFASEFASPHPQNVHVDFFSEPENFAAQIAEAVEKFSPDWILQIDDSSPLVHSGLENFDIPKAWYSVDSHIHGGWHPHYAALFDLVFCAQKSHLKVMQKYQPNTLWMPTFYSGTPEFLDWQKRSYEVSFVGTLDPNTNPRRIRLLEKLQSLDVPIHIHQGAYSPIYSNSRVVINQSTNDDLNFRFFEAMGCGALLITDKISHSLQDLGEPGRDFLLYEPDDVQDLYEKICWVRTHPQEAEDIARNGHRLTLKHHLASHRADSISKAFALPRPFGKTASIFALAHLSWTLGYLSRLQLPDFLVRFFNQEAIRHAEQVEENSPGNPWSCLVLARISIDEGNEKEALEYLLRIGSVPADPVLRKSYFFLQALIEAYGGDTVKARQKLKVGLKEFPQDAELVQLYAFLDNP